MARKKELVPESKEFEIEVEGESYAATGVETMETEEAAPSITSPEWSDYVMSQFDDSELDNGFPKVDGLRRVAQKLLGEILFSGVQQVFPSSESGTIGRVTVVYAIEFAWSLGVEFRSKDITVFDYPVKRFSDVADAWSGNAEYKYAIHTASLAATKAEARVLRKALQLKTLAAEEVSAKTLDVPDADSETITSSQYSVIQSKCDQLGIDMIKLGSLVELNNNPLKWTKNDGAKLMSKINKYQTEAEGIPAEIIK